MQPQTQSKVNKVIIPLLLVISFAAVIVLQLGFIFIMLALVPALAAYFIDNHPGLPIFKTVLACNLAGILPIVNPMLKAAFNMEAFDAVSIMSNPLNWVVVYGSAVLGCALIFLCRVIASFIMTIVYEYKVAALERTQKRLLDEWGQNIK